jgi:hypothetical protein
MYSPVREAEPKGDLAGRGLAPGDQEGSLVFLVPPCYRHIDPLDRSDSDEPEGVREDGLGPRGDELEGWDHEDGEDPIIRGNRLAAVVSRQTAYREYKLEKKNSRKGTGSPWKKKGTYSGYDTYMRKNGAPPPSSPTSEAPAKPKRSYVRKRSAPGTGTTPQNGVPAAPRKPRQYKKKGT